MKKLIALCCVVFASVISLNSYADLSGYAVEKRKVFSDFIFLPIKGSEKQGSFLYTRYKKNMLPAVNLGGGWRSVTLSLTPTAIDSTAYSQFILSNGIVDNRKNLIPSDATLCLLSNAAKQKITDLGLIYVTNLLIGGYPKACSLTIRYYTTSQSTQELALLDYLNTNSVISLSFRIEELVSPAVEVSFHDIVSELYNNGVLQKDALNYYYGSIASITYHAANLPPILFGGTDETGISFDSWELFLNAFSVSNKTLKVQLTSSNEILTVPAVEEEIVNVNTTL